MSDKRMIQSSDRSKPTDRQGTSGHLNQAAELRATALAGGLRFIVYLPPVFAGWLLDQVEDGLFASPKEAVFALVGLHCEREPFTATREELLRRAWLAMCLDNPHLGLPEKNITEHVENILGTPLSKPAVWREHP